MAPTAAGEKSASPPASDGGGCVEQTALRALHLHTMDLPGHRPSDWL